MASSTVQISLNWQSKLCEEMGAPFTAEVLRTLVEDPAVSAAFAPVFAPYADRTPKEFLTAAVPLRALGALHFLALSGAAPSLAACYAARTGEGLGPAILDAVQTNPDVPASFMASPPQTNEVRRSLGLVGGFLTVAQETGLPLRCLELGASAGLNMNWDRYAYDFGEGRRWGESDAALTLSGDWSGPAPPLDAKVEVVEKLACDQSPIDVRSEAGALRLQAYIWPDQTERLERIRAAIDLTRRTDIRVEKADAGDWVRANVNAKSGMATVVYHSSFLQYPPPEVQAAIIEAIKAAGESASPDAPLAWLRKEPTDASAVRDEVRLTLWPGGEDRLLARAHPHGASVEWLCGTENAA
jgi:hypothetical protein